MKHKSLSLRLFDRNAALPVESLSVRAAKYRQHEDAVDQPADRPREMHYREIHFAFQLDGYEPLTEDEEVKEDKKKRKKEKYKKVKKNVGKVLRSSWKCFMLGMYNFAFTYSTPITVAAAFIPDYHVNGSRG
ncbi:uncharacterized protein C1orf115-like [Thalassophryne amazonica]|uniref:uncharacterized protein C1orf115-like n=1 Tax=Thalassophryne amazonica TaxID=390379 RepID=UPI00147230FB|nr:uncharacterized protein C1orf115-like [Thalassophryne amazonica]